MFEIKESSIKWKGRELHIKTGEVARQTAGVASVSYGGTVILAAVTVQKDSAVAGKPSDLSGLALVTNFLAKSYALGRIPTGFFKREGKLTEREILASRVVDRAVRPLIQENLVNEVNIVCKLLAHDSKNVLPEVPALIAASVALKLSGIPFKGPVVGVNITKGADGVVSYNQAREADSVLELFAACTKDSVVMVESEANEVSEPDMVSAIEDALESTKPVIEFIDTFLSDIPIQKSVGVLYENDELHKKVKETYEKRLRAIYNAQIKSKEERYTLLDEIYFDAYAKFGEMGFTDSEVRFFIKKVEKEIVKENTLQNGVRIDGRSLSEIRPISISLDYLPGTHGSALFTRGGTQSLVVTTLGSYQDEQIVDDIDGERRESVLLHYNFLPYAVGEVGALRAPGRREVGHGRLALKALKAVLPTKSTFPSTFPYTIRIVSEITESDGSSSMATVCGSSLALMDTGVPITKHVAGIAMGLITDGEKYAVLSDISGDEDALGDMDFKVAGTQSGITALQMDMKVQGISVEIIEKALNQALEGRMHILGKMLDAISTPRDDVKSSAPKILCYEIHKDVVHKVIGSGGKTIKGISCDTASKIDIDANNFVHIMADSKETLMKAKARIDAVSGITENTSNPPLKISIGKVYEGKIVSVVDFGLFVLLPNKQEGLVHISEISKERINDIRASHTEGQTVTVRVKDIGPDGKIKLTMRITEDRSSPAGESGSGGRSSSSSGKSSHKEQRGGSGHRRSHNTDRSSYSTDGDDGSYSNRKRFF